MRNGADRDDAVTDGSSADTGGDWNQVVQRHYDPDRDEELTTAIVFTIADAMGVQPTEVRSPPLYEYVDVAALEESFFGPNVVDTPRQCVGTVEFRYREYHVVVRGDGWIQVHESVDRNGP